MIKEIKINWYRTNFNSDILKQLTKRQNLRPILHVLAQILFSVITGYACWFVFLHYGWLAMMPILYFHGIFYSFLSLTGILHELSHNTVFKSKRLNQFFNFFISFFSWNNPVYFRASHTKHHSTTMFKGTDYEQDHPQNVTLIEWFFLLTFNLPGMFSRFFKIFRHAIGLLHGEWEHYLFERATSKRRMQLFLWSSFVFAGNIFLAYFFIKIDQPVLILIVQFGKFFGEWLSKVVGETQHVGMMSNSSDYRLCCRSIRINRLLEFFY